MRKILHIISVLTAVGVLSGTCLVFMYKYAAPLIAENEKKATSEAVFKVFPDADSFNNIKNVPDTVFLVEDKKGKSLGYAFTAKGNGYQGEIILMVGVSLDLETISGIEILKSQETPGLGQEITNIKYKKQFINLRTLPEIICVKGPPPKDTNEVQAVTGATVPAKGTNKIQAITGATISSKAVAAIINSEVKKLRQRLEGIKQL